MNIKDVDTRGEFAAEIANEVKRIAGALERAYPPNGWEYEETWSMNLRDYPVGTEVISACPDPNNHQVLFLVRWPRPVHKEYYEKRTVTSMGEVHRLLDENWVLYAANRTNYYMRREITQEEAEAQVNDKLVQIAAMISAAQDFDPDDAAWMEWDREHFDLCQSISAVLK